MTFSPSHLTSFHIMKAFLCTDGANLCLNEVGLFILGLVSVQAMEFMQSCSFNKLLINSTKVANVLVHYFYVRLHRFSFFCKWVP